MVQFLFYVLLIVAANIHLVFTQDFSSEVKAQAPIILKALNSNSTLKDKIKSDCLIAVLFNPASQMSEQEKKSIISAIEENGNIKVHGKKVKALEIPMTPDLNLEKKVIINKINAFWLASELQPFMDTIRESAKYNQVITISADDRLVNEALVTMGTQKTTTGYRLIVNMQEAQNINIDLNKNLLSEAIIIP